MKGYNFLFEAYVHINVDNQASQAVDKHPTTSVASEKLTVSGASRAPAKLVIARRR